MRITATSRPRDDYDGEPHRWDLETDAYTDDAMAEIVDQTPAGHVLLHVMVAR